MLTTGMRLCRARSSGRRLTRPEARCVSTTNDMPGSAGISMKNSSSASRPPADAPRPTTRCSALWSRASTSPCSVSSWSESLKPPPIRNCANGRDADRPWVREYTRGKTRHNVKVQLPPPPGTKSHAILARVRSVLPSARARRGHLSALRARALSAGAPGRAQRDRRLRPHHGRPGAENSAAGLRDSAAGACAANGGPRSASTPARD
jgi:hypothetical protein